MSTTTEKRARRVERRAIPEVVEAVHAGKLSVRLADELLYLPRARQRAELQRRLHAQDEAERRSRVVTETIRQYLDSNSTIDLEMLRSQIRAAAGRQISGAC